MTTGIISGDKAVHILAADTVGFAKAECRLSIEGCQAVESEVLHPREHLNGRVAFLKRLDYLSVACIFSGNNTGITLHGDALAGKEIAAFALIFDEHTGDFGSCLDILGMGRDVGEKEIDFCTVVVEGCIGAERIAV